MKKYTLKLLALSFIVMVAIFSSQLFFDDNSAMAQSNSLDPATWLDKVKDYRVDNLSSVYEKMKLYASYALYVSFEFIKDIGYYILVAIAFIIVGIFALSLFQAAIPYILLGIVITAVVIVVRFIWY